MEREILDAAKIVETVDVLSMRIKDRFPDSELHHVCRRLYDVGKETGKIIEQIATPNFLYRVLVGGFILLVLIGLGYGISAAKADNAAKGLFDWVQVSEAGLNTVVLLGAAVIFLVSVETRAKRKKVIIAVNRLRSIAHVVDAHQLTKDPDGVASVAQNTKHSPKRTLTPFLLGRYLDYCSEMLALTGKIGFLYVQRFSDPVAVNAVNELENLTTSLSRKIWQKIMILRSSNPEVKEEPKPITEHVNVSEGIHMREAEPLPEPEPPEEDYPGSSLGLPEPEPAPEPPEEDYPGSALGLPKT